MENEREKINNKNNLKKNIYIENLKTKDFNISKDKIMVSFMGTYFAVAKL